MFIRELLFTVPYYMTSGIAFALSAGLMWHKIAERFPELELIPFDSVLLVSIPLGLVGGLVLGLRRVLAETRSERYRRRVEVAKW